jgi:precorrin-6B methylase 2
MWNRNIRTLLKEAYKREMRFDNLLDIGAGKGKPCIYAGKKHAYNKIIGVEFSQPLIEIAEKNRVKSNLPNLSFVNCDATQYFLPEGLNLIFLVNPFDDDTLSKFIQLNLNHFKDQHSVIAYLNDVHRNTLTKFGFETFFRDQTRKISLYQLT